MVAYFLLGGHYSLPQRVHVRMNMLYSGDAYKAEKTCTVPQTLLEAKMQWKTPQCCEMLLIMQQ